MSDVTTKIDLAYGSEENPYEVADEMSELFGITVTVERTGFELGVAEVTLSGHAEYVAEALAELWGMSDAEIQRQIRG